MQWKTSKIIDGGRVMASLWLVGILIVTSGGTVMAQSNSGSQESLAGAWAIQVTLRDCSTEAPLGPAFNALVSFHRGGTLSESNAGPGFAIGQRTAGHGNWSRLRGRTFSQRMVSLIVFDTDPNLPGTPGFDPKKPVSPGFFTGWMIVSHTVRLTDDDHLMSSGTNTFYKANGEVYRTGCSTAAGQRFN
jgi:hypothetical protein